MYEEGIRDYSKEVEQALNFLELLDAHIDKSKQIEQVKSVLLASYRLAEHLTEELVTLKNE